MKSKGLFVQQITGIIGIILVISGMFCPKINVAGIDQSFVHSGFMELYWIIITGQEFCR